MKEDKKEEKLEEKIEEKTENTEKIEENIENLNNDEEEEILEVMEESKQIGTENFESKNESNGQVSIKIEKDRVDDNLEEEEPEPECVDWDEVLHEQLKDPKIQKIRSEISTPKKFRKNLDFFTHEGRLYRMGYDKGKRQMLRQLVIPRTLVKKVLNQFHGANIGGHFNAN